MSERTLPYHPPALIMELASGLAQPEDVAARFGYTPEQWGQMRNDPALQRQVAERQAALRADGHPERAALTMCVVDVLEELYVVAKQPETDPEFKLRYVKTALPYTNLVPKKDEQASAAPAISITINLRGKKISGSLDAPIDSSATRVADDELPAMPAELVSLVEHAESLSASI